MCNGTSSSSYTAFEGTRCIAHGALQQVALAAKQAMDMAADAAHALPILVFDDATSETLELDWRGSTEAFAARLEATVATAPAPHPPEAEVATQTQRGPGRPKLGVIAREVTLLPRHWEWLSTQPGGASVALRKLVEQARRAASSADRIRQAQDATYRFMSVMAGCLEGFEEAARALFAADGERFAALIAAWPADLGAHLRQLAAPAFEKTNPAEASDA